MVTQAARRADRVCALGDLRAAVGTRSVESVDVADTGDRGGLRGVYVTARTGLFPRVCRRSARRPGNAF